ncbi:MAG: VOC family protein [Planctomycetes bacterium]|nr:VOC family protein [Planctomycetota bacterium]
MGNPFVHVELQTNDVARAKEFYGALLDWKLEDIPPDGEYTMVHVGEGVGGGMMKCPVPGIPSHWLAYISVADVAATTQKAKELGATVLCDRTEVPGIGWFSVIADPTGAVVAFWECKRPG